MVRFRASVSTASALGKNCRVSGGKGLSLECTSPRGNRHFLHTERGWERSVRSVSAWSAGQATQDAVKCKQEVLAGRAAPHSMPTGTGSAWAPGRAGRCPGPVVLTIVCVCGGGDPSTHWDSAQPSTPRPPPGRRPLSTCLLEFPVSSAVVSRTFYAL